MRQLHVRTIQAHEQLLVEKIRARIDFGPFVDENSRKGKPRQIDNALNAVPVTNSTEPVGVCRLHDGRNIRRIISLYYQLLALSPVATSEAVKI